MIIGKKSQTTVNGYINIWQTRFSTLNNAVTEVATTADAVPAASNVSSALAPKAQTSSGYQSSDAWGSFQFDAEFGPPGSGLPSNSFY